MGNNPKDDAFVFDFNLDSEPCTTLTNNLGKNCHFKRIREAVILKGSTYIKH